MYIKAMIPNDKNKNKTSKKVSLVKPMKQRKMSESRKDEYLEIDYQKTIDILKNYYVPREEYVEKNYHILLISTINKKLNSYKQQDLNKNKYNPDEFINVENVIDKLLTTNLICYYCSNKTQIFYTYSREPTQWTLERIDNTIGHTNANTEISCLECNLKRRDRSSKDFKFAKQLVIKKV